MDLFEFTEECQRLEKWTKKLSDDQRMMLYKKFGLMPLEAFRDVVDQIINTTRPGSPFPSPALIDEYWKAWLESHPELVTHKYDESCKDCGGKGYIEAQKWSEFYNDWVDVVFSCGSCSKTPRYGPLATKAQIENTPGFRLKVRKPWVPEHNVLQDLNEIPF